MRMEKIQIQVDKEALLAAGAVEQEDGRIVIELTYGPTKSGEKKPWWNSQKGAVC